MTGNPGLDKIILAINGLIVAAAAGLVFYAHTQINPLKTNESLEFGNLIEGSVNEYQKPPVAMDEIVVNLYSREARLRFLNTKMNIVLLQEKDRNYVTNLKVIINDSLIDIAGNMKPDELNSVTGRLLLENRIKKRVNKFAKRNVIKKILFSKFIVQ